MRKRTPDCETVIALKPYEPTTKNSRILMKYVKPILRFLKLFIAFFLVMAGAYGIWQAHHADPIFDRTEPTLRCIAMIAIGLTILWVDFPATLS